MIEVWGWVVGAEGQYQISTLGNARSLDRTITFPDGITRLARGQDLKPQIKTHYYTVWINGVQRFIHDLVMETFVGPKPLGQCVRHGLMGSLVNSIENLCYGTRSENEYDKVDDGRHHQSLKTMCPNKHEYDAVDNRGRRYCKPCKNANERKRLSGVAS